MIALVALTPRASAKAGEPATGTVTGKVTVFSNNKPVGATNVYVYVVDDVDPDGTRLPKVAIAQHHKAFVPALVVVPAGTQIGFPNRDKIEHSVFANDPNYFDLGRDKVVDKSYRFEFEGEIDIYCDIHPTMSAKVKVMPSSRFAQVRPDGSFTIEVPAGNRKLAAWMPDASEPSRTIKVEPGQTATVELKLSADRPKPRKHRRKNGTSYDTDRYED